MAFNIGANVNWNNTAILSGAIALNDTTSVKIQDSNSLRIMLIISNPSNKDVWIKFQAASVDNDKKGIHIPARGYFEMPGNIYRGEVSAIAENGTPSVYTTEY